ncbi:HAMP domain-containing sensor histidine kinase [Pseudomonas bijieensis]|uniref:HAMP domain-containing sensor histidine kinase n=1 Tax=Pseudomonas sp. 43mfcvi1.1 TaxID=1761894 RepID=UPI000D6D8B34|nr:histidine kinase [Pseudomonas sp. 43mfcvi1.1]PWJ35303.1 two-component system sensor histidine kinase UhpB [Pseudomonas sp. 43mfcvi1.1]QIB08398.1 HAMP domain-containing sensor histidine kinase [Pseudomonas fluorescens]SSB97351.1 two-component system, NarL family, sensor histidine kinase UhpB [Pseudomonas sp. 43mfcvi1.1]
MSALWRINLWVSAFFALVTLACAVLLLHQATTDVRRELQSAESVVHYLRETAERDPASLQMRLTGSLRHVRVHWLAPGELFPADEKGIKAWFGRRLLEDGPAAQVVDLPDGRRAWIAVDPRDEIDEIIDSLVQLLGVCALALLLSLLVIRWAVRRGMRLLDELLQALRQVSAGNLQVRLGTEGLPEAQQLARYFNRMTAALAEAQADNARLTQALLAVQEQERTRLAQTLHDDLGQYVAGIRAHACLLRLVTNQPQALEQTVSQLEDHCEHLQHGFRALVHDLYPVVLQHLSLSDAIGVLAGQWQKTQGIACRVSIDEALPPLSGADKTHLYRLLQEALTNVARHAGASEVRIRLQHRAGRLRLLVRDNGRGATQPARAGVGLHSMSERARSLGGELRIISQPGAGWALALNIALEA